MNRDIMNKKKRIRLIVFLVTFAAILAVFLFLNNKYTVLKNEYNGYFIADVSAADNGTDLKYSKVMPCRGLNKMKDLRSLEVTGCSDFGFLNNMPKLKTLTIWTGSGGNTISSFPYSQQIEELIVQNDRAALDFDECIGNLPNLKRITLVNTYLDKENSSITEMICSCSNLEEIHSIGPGGQWYDFEKIRQLKKLEYLDLSEIDINDIDPLKDCQSLKELYVKIKDQHDLRCISEISSLETVTIRNAGDKNETISLDNDTMSKLTSLNKLSVYGFKITDTEGLLNLPKIKKICLNKGNMLEEDIRVLRKAGIEVELE